MLTEYTELAKKTFVPDAVLPEQFFHSACLNTHPLARLALGVLEKAWEDITKYNQMTQRRAARLYREARDYFFDDSPEAHQWPLSFVNACLLTGLNPEYIRRGLQQRMASLPAGKPAYQSPSKILKAWQTRVRRDRLRGDELLIKHEGPTYSLGRFLNADHLNSYREWARKHPAQAIQETHHVAHAA